ncbi:hypothetical protein V5F53_05335 [Xanthobacter sp. V4C-4]|uniref:hypothetical protein n=1 Tax=Xanthobacter cornucopiae TaxID=3119924 RepID=UPI00372ACFFF
MTPSPLSRRGALALAVAALAAGAATPARSADHYMALGLPFFEPYRVGIATVEVGDDKATGTIAPPAGDPRPALPFTGTLVNGILKVNVGTGADSYVLTFTESERGLHQVWDEATTIGDLERITLFRPAADFSDTALVLQHVDDNWCGQVYGGLSVALRPEVLKSAAAAPAALADLDVAVAGPARGTGTAKLKDVWSRLRLAARGGEDVAVDIVVPIGQEAARAKALRADPAVLTVGLPNACTEMALAVVPRAKVSEGAVVSDAKLKTYLETALGRLLAGAPAEGAAGGARKFKLAGVSVAKGAGGAPVFHATVTGESDATRLEKGSWDQFVLSVQPVVTAADTGDSISLIPTITEVRTARKSGAQMPADSAFKPVDDDAVTAGITHRLVSWLATAEGSRCDFLTRAGFDEPEGAYSCTNQALDDVAHPDDN